MITSEWGTPNMVKDGIIPELLLGGKYGHKIHIFDLHTRRHLQELDLGARATDGALELRPSHHDPQKTYGFSGVVISLKDLSSSIWMWYREGDGKDGKWAINKVIEIPAEPADPAKLPPLLKGFKAVPPLVTDINLSLDDRYLYVSCWGTGEFIQHDVSDPAHPKKTARCISAASCAVRRTPRNRSAAQRRPADGGDQPRRQARLFHQLALLAVGRAVLSGPTPELDGKGRREDPKGGMELDPKSSSLNSRAAHAPDSTRRR